MRKLQNFVTFCRKLAILWRAIHFTVSRIGCALPITSQHDISSQNIINF